MDLIKLLGEFSHLQLDNLDLLLGPVLVGAQGKVRLNLKIIGTFGKVSIFFLGLSFTIGGVEHILLGVEHILLGTFGGVELYNSKRLMDASVLATNTKSIYICGDPSVSPDTWKIAR